MICFSFFIFIFRNSRELGLGIRYPTRDTQKQLFRWLFIVSYLLQGALFSAVLANVTSDAEKWVVNVGFDLVLVSVFAIYFNNVHNQNVSLFDLIMKTVLKLKLEFGDLLSTT